MQCYIVHGYIKQGTAKVGEHFKLEAIPTHFSYHGDSDSKSTYEQLQQEINSTNPSIYPIKPYGD
jgi:hypothetical protein